MEGLLDLANGLIKANVRCVVSFYIDLMGI